MQRPQEVYLRKVFMRRREFVALLAVALSPRLARAQHTGKQYRVALIHSGIPVEQLNETAGPYWVRRFFAELRRLGYVEGRNLVVERYSAEGRHDRFAAIAREVVATRPDLIVANLNFLVASLKAATTTIPILGVVADPIRSGLVTNLARPGGNLTGVSVDAGLGIYGKRLEILKDLVPSASRIAYLATRVEWDGVGGRELRAVARDMSLTVVSIAPEPVSPPELRRAFAEMAAERPDALLVSPSGDFLAHRQLIIDLVRDAHLPAMYPYREFVELGGLVAYATDLTETAEQLADQVHRVLNGSSPSEIPFYQASRFQLLLNGRAVKTLGITVAPTFLGLVDEVIE